jgi:lysophospholipase L1-like esterase
MPAVGLVTRKRFGRLAAVAGLLAAPVLLGAATASAATAPKQVHLGDSYAAGPLIVPQDPALPGCLRSLVDYGRLVAKSKGYAVTDASCSGATTKDMTAPQDTGYGTNPPQLDRLTADTSVVTLTIGGNDIGFTSIIENCIAYTPGGPTRAGTQTCEQYYTAGGTDQLTARIDATEPKVEAVLAEIHRRSPDARVYLAGYPAILPENNVGCWPQMPLTQPDVPYLRGVEQDLNQMLKDAAAAQSATYVDTYGPTLGHDACQLPVVRWVEPLVPAQDAAPVHPNRAGERAMAGAVSATIG